MARHDLLIRLTPAELSRCKQAAALRWQLARVTRRWVTQWPCR